MGRQLRSGRSIAIAAADEEDEDEQGGQEHSESDSEGDILVSKSPSNTKRTRDLVSPLLQPSTQLPRHPTRVREGTLDMIHNSLLTYKPDGGLKYNIDNGISEFVSRDSALYKCGGMVVRVGVSTKWHMDVMVCFDERCDFCSRICLPGETSEDRKRAVEVEEAREADSYDERYFGLPCVHAKDIRRSRAGWTFEPGSGVTCEREDGLGPDIEVLFPRRDYKIKLRCILCDDSCELCTPDEEMQESQVEVSSGSGLKGSKGKERQSTLIVEKDAAMVAVSGANGTAICDITDGLYSRQSGHAVQGRRPSSGVSRPDAILWNREVRVDDSGNVYKEHVSPHRSHPPDKE